MFSKSVVKYIQSLQHKKFRDEHNAFIAEGPKVVEELLSSQYFQVRNIYATDCWIKAHTAIASRYDAHITEVKDFELQKLTALQTPNQVMAEFEKRKPFLPNDFRNKITLILDDIRDPGNLGTIIRIADWFEVTNIICSESTVDMYNPKVVQSTMASLGRVNVVYTALEGFINLHRHIDLYCAVLDGKPVKKKSIQEGLVVIGNESNGIHADLLALPHEKISIEKFGAAESLNAAVATGIILYAMK